MPRAHFRDVLKQPLGFLIPVTTELADLDDEVFTVGLAEYEVAIEFWMTHKLVGDTDTTVISLNQTWLTIFQDLGDLIVYQNDMESTSSGVVEARRPNSTIMKQNILILNEIAKASATRLMEARNELCSSMNPEAFKCFPAGEFSVPGITTSPTVVNLYSIKFLSRKPTLNL